MVRLEHVTKVFEKGGDKVVNDVSFEVKKGEIVVLIGPSGCGKTTTLKMINRLIPLSGGKIFVKGQDIEKTDPVSLRRGIGYVIQQIGLLPHLTIRENIAFVLQLMGSPKSRQKERAEELIQAVGLPLNYLDKHPRQLSGGQQQRIGVARALAADPDIILMDEPFGALDPITREQLQLELLRLQEQLHKTIVFVTHDMQEAFKIGTRIVLMRNGKIEKIGDALTLARDKSAFVQEFLGRKAVFDALDTIPVGRIIDLTVPIVEIGSRWEPKKENQSWEYAVAVNGKGEFLGVIPYARLTAGEPVREEQVLLMEEMVGADNSVQEIIRKMLCTGRSWIPICNEAGRFQGLVTFEACAGMMVS